MYIDKDVFTVWMERIMDRFDMPTLESSPPDTDPLPEKRNTPLPYAGWQVLLPCNRRTQVNP